MKQKGPAPAYYRLPNATVQHHATGSYQYYFGDFFLLLVSQPSSPSAHLSWLQVNREPGWNTQFLYAHPDFLFELWMDSAVADEYEGLKGQLHLHPLLPYPSLELDRIVLSFFRTVPSGGLADRFLYARVVELLLQLVMDILQQRTASRIRESVAAVAEQAKAIIQSDWSVYDTVESLARKTGVSKKELQYAFKKRYGMTVGRFSKEERLKQAQYLLRTTDDILLSVAMAVGYNDTANFSAAFKSYFGYTPGTLQKRKKESGAFSLKQSSDS